MKFKNAVFLKYSGQELGESYWGRLDKVCESRQFVTPDDPKLPQHLSNADCLLVKLGAKVGKDIIDAAPNLKYIGMLGTGYGGIDVTYAAQRNIAVCNIAGYSTQGVAEFAFASILEYLRELERAKRQAREGNYSESGFTGTEIAGKTFAVIGLGRIGQRIAQIARGFGANVIYWSRTRRPEAEREGIAYRELVSLVQEADFISLNLTYNSQTEGFLNQDRINYIKSGAVLLNLSPMELIDLDALAERLKQGNLTFILDHSDEMTAEQLAKIKSYSNCVIYPPVAYTTNEATALKQELFTGNVENFLAGKPTNKVN